MMYSIYFTLPRLPKKNKFFTQAVLNGDSYLPDENLRFKNACLALYWDEILAVLY